MKPLLKWLTSNWSLIVGGLLMISALLILLTACSSPMPVVSEPSKPPEQLLTPLKGSAEPFLFEVQQWLEDVAKYLEKP
nr:MAG TPA: TRAF PROTEIN, TRAO PROTEIN, TRAN ADHESION, BACTERIAL SECRETION.5A [Caudoviricetes sp.]